MKKRFFAYIFFALSLGGIFPASTISDSPLEALTSHNLAAAYADFLNYRDTHSHAYDETIQPAIAFAYELKERDETLLALQILNCAEFLDASTLSANDHTLLRNIIRGCGLTEIAMMFENSITQPWLLEKISTVVPPHAGFFAAAKLAISDEPERRQQGALALFSLITNDSTDIVLKRKAAELATHIIDEDYDSYLSDEQLDVVSGILVDGINDGALDIEDRLSLVDALLWNCCKKDLGTPEQRHLAVETIFSLSEHSLASLEQKIQCAQTAINAANRKYIDDNKYWQQLPILSRTQRLAAIARIESLIDKNSEKSFFINIFAAQEEENNGAVHFSNNYLTTHEQRMKIIQNLQQTLRDGHPYQKIKAARRLTNFDSPEAEAIFELRKEATEFCLTVLNSSQFSYTEQMLATWNILNSTCFQEEKYIHIASDEARRTAIQCLIKLVSIPDFGLFDKCLNMNGILVNGILAARDIEGELLLAKNELSKVINLGINVLNDPRSENDSKYCLISNILELKELKDHGLTKEQFELIFPAAFLVLTKSLNNCYSPSESKANLASRILCDSFASEEQRQQILQIFIGEMNDAEKTLEDRKSNARFIRDSSCASSEQKAAAATVLSLP